MTRKRTTLRLPVALRAALMRESKRRGISFNRLVLELLLDSMSDRLRRSYGVGVRASVSD